MQGQSLSETALSGKKPYPMIDSATAAAAGRSQEEAYVSISLSNLN